MAKSRPRKNQSEHSNSLQDYLAHNKGSFSIFRKFVIFFNSFESKVMAKIILQPTKNIVNSQKLFI